MVSPAARPYIDASVPVLREHGQVITRTFYRNMFAAHPELTNLFNMGNQASGVQQQSLAAAVFAYAANIDNAGALAPVVSRIVHKHASVGITSHHYPIVGRHLLGAIQEVLGDAATPDLLGAWSEAYGELASALIAAEKLLYEQAAIEPGQMRMMRVRKAVRESVDITSFVLEPTDGKAAPAFQPGQYVSVRVAMHDGRTQMRQYSLSDAPNPQTIRISVKRESVSGQKPAGEISNWLHDNLTEGTEIAVGQPFGDFIVDVRSNTPLVLLSAGVGITPMIAALNTLARDNPHRRVLFAHAAKSVAHHAHRADIQRALSAMMNLQVTFFYEAGAGKAGDEQAFDGYMDVAKLPAWPRAQADVYLCGPLGFMQQQWRSLVESGVPAQKLHREVFGPELLDHLI